MQQHYGQELAHTIPGWLVELMMCAFKIHRSSRGYQEDNYTDLAAYAHFAREDQAREAGKPSTS